MKVIWKAVLVKSEDSNTARAHMDINAKVLCAQMQNGQRTVWFESEAAPLNTADREFYILPTGMGEVPEDGRYIGTVQDGGGYVWHIYEKV